MISYPPDRHTAPLVEDRLKLDIRWIARTGLLTSEPCGFCLKNSHMALGAVVVLQRKGLAVEITILGDRAGTESLTEFRVALERTDCRFGYFRFWWRCPGCQRRCAVLYWPEHLECRVCHGLVYRSQRLTALKRQVRQASAVRRRLGGSGSSLEPFPIKPKGMHWSTYERLETRDAVAWRRLRSWTLAQIPPQRIDWDDA